MPLIVERVSRPADLTQSGLIDWATNALNGILDALRGLVSLDGNVRATRTLNAERAQLFGGVAVTSAATVTLASLFGALVTTDNWTTAAIAFDSTGGTGRYRIDGGAPSAAAAADSGMPIPSGFSTLTIVGLQNIRSFSVIGETGQTLNMSVTLFK